MFKKFANKVKSAVSTAKVAVMSHKAEGYVDSGVKILIAVVIGALLLGGLYLLFNGTKQILILRKSPNCGDFLAF